MPSIYDNRDKNEPEIIRAFESAGALAYQIKGSRKSGIPDLLVGFSGKWVLVEVKNRHGKNRIHKSQKAFFELCDYRGLPCFVVRTPEDCITVLKEI